jgi:DNA anti-recombination protein RmuC
MLLRQLLAIEQRQTKLLEDLLNQVSISQRQRAAELGQWRQANPHLAKKCREAAEALARVQTEFLHQLTEEVNTNFDALLDGEFMFTEFVDRFGPRMAHLNGILQVLAQLSSPPTTANSSNNNSP